MYFDKGRIKDLDMLTKRLHETTDPKIRRTIQRTIDGIKRQAEDSKLGRERDEIIELRRKMSLTHLRAEADGYRDEADRMEERIYKEG